MVQIISSVELLEIKKKDLGEDRCRFRKLCDSFSNFTEDPLTFIW